MEKPFDVKELIARGKKEVSPDFEKILRKGWGVVKGWVKDSAAMLSNPFLKVGIPFAVDTADPLVIAELDKVDGEIQG
jgi:hypothetical protein